MTALFTSLACSAECDLKPKPAAPIYFENPEPTFWGGPYTLHGAVPAVPPPPAPGSRAWAIYQAAGGHKLEVRMVPQQGAQNFYNASNWNAAKDPLDSAYDDFWPFTTEWRIAP
jgi:hypothetical protein